jgi:triosephosphate isomerase
MASPLIVVNHKTYESAQGEASATLARSIEAAAKPGVRMVSVVSPFDLSATVAAAPNIEVWAQHLDPIGFGSNTGRLHPATAIASGATGSIINHAERKVPIEHVEELLASLPNDFVVCACASDLEEARALAALSPDFIAVEPPELIGGDISVTSADPEIIRATVEAVHAVDSTVRVLCGAGVKSGEDVATAIELGAEGVLLASGVTKSNDPAAVLIDLVRLL